MKYFFILILLLTFGCKDQSQSKQNFFYNKAFKWTISIPAGFDTVSAAQWAKMQQRGMDAIEATHGFPPENNSKTIFVFKNDQFNYFEANYQPLELLPEDSYFEYFKGVNNLIYETFQAQMEHAQLDSTYSIQTISGLEFQTLKIHIVFPNKMVMNFFLYRRPFGNNEFCVNIMTADKQKEAELLDAWLNSKFGD